MKNKEAALERKRKIEQEKREHERKEEEGKRKVWSDLDCAEGFLEQEEDWENAEMENLKNMENQWAEACKEAEKRQPPATTVEGLWAASQLPIPPLTCGTGWGNNRGGASKSNSEEPLGLYTFGAPVEQGPDTACGSGVGGMTQMEPLENGQWICNLCEDSGVILEKKLTRNVGCV